MAKFEVTFTQNVKLGADTFRKGESATVDEADLEGLEGVILPDYKEVEAPEDEPSTVDEMTVAQLKEHAEKYGIDLAGLKKRDEMLEAIQAHREKQ